MKKIIYFVFAAVAMAFVSCAKETAKETVSPEPANPVKETITFSATIDLDSQTKATLSDHAIHWAAGDVIGVANDFNNDIESCAVTPDGVDPTKCTFTATAVGGATTYYAICIGDNITGISFDHTTAVFSGLNNPNHTFTKDAVSADRLAMAGKSTDKSSISFSPCLALIKFKIAAESVAAKYAEGYSGIRGFNLIIKHSGNRINPTGDYTVNLSGAMNVAYAGTNGANYIQVNEGSDLMSSTANYYLTVIPAGAVETFQLQPFGFNSSSEATWSTIYPMTLSQTVSMDPGDYFDFGTLNPVGLKKAQDAFTPAIAIDGNMDDWATVDMYPLDNTKDAFPGDGTRILNWKVKSDAQYVYVYFKISESQAQTRGTWSGYLPVGFDTDNDTATGEAGSYGLGDGFEARAIAFPLSNDANNPVTFFDPASPCEDNNIKCPISGSSLGGFPTAGCLDGEGNGYVEISIPRAKIGSPTGTIRINVAMSSLASGAQTYTLE